MCISKPTWAAIGLALSFLLFSFSSVNAQSPWSKTLSGIGTFSSPRVADLNGDQIGDIILGAGREEFQKCDSAIIALDGQTGELLWNVAANDQIFASAALRDISGDGTVDIFIGGRAGELKAIDGRSGELLWDFLEINPHKKKKRQEWYNFYNAQWIPDQDKDGVGDLLVSNGGDVLAAPYDPNRPCAYLLVISGKTGKVLAKAAVPDGKETYMSVAAYGSTTQDIKVIFGTGGETIGGSLYVAPLSMVLAEDLSQAIQLERSADKGFIGPPAWVDITEDAYPDIIANAVDGRLLAFDGQSYEKLWEVKIPNTEAYSSIAVGYFNQDQIPDFFVSYAQGVWPKLEWLQQFMVDGASGTIQFKEQLGFFQTSTPVVLDVNQDGLDEALLLVSYQVQDDLLQKEFFTMPMLIDFKTGKALELGVNFAGGNISSTPWIGDMDGNGFLDIVLCHGENSKVVNDFTGMVVERLTTKIPARNIRWGAYMGSNYDGVFPMQKRINFKIGGD